MEILKSKSFSKKEWGLRVISAAKGIYIEVCFGKRSWMISI